LLLRLKRRKKKRLDRKYGTHILALERFTAPQGHFLLSEASKNQYICTNGRRFDRAKGKNMKFAEYVSELKRHNLTDEQELTLMYLPLASCVMNGEFLSAKLFKFYIELRNMWLDLGIVKRVDLRHWYVTHFDKRTSL
jgi:hypothetical protein